MAESTVLQNGCWFLAYKLGHSRAWIAKWLPCFFFNLAILWLVHHQKNILFFCFWHSPSRNEFIFLTLYNQFWPRLISKGMNCVVGRFNHSYLPLSRWVELVDTIMNRVSEIEPNPLQVIIMGINLITMVIKKSITLLLHITMVLKKNSNNRLKTDKSLMGSFVKACGFFWSFFLKYPELADLWLWIIFSNTRTQ
jgi:hypothetical protein